MKTSNKLLTTLAALLIIIPIIVVAVNVKINYRPSKGDTFAEDQEINAEPFDKKSSGRTSMPIKTPFNSVNVPDAKRIYLELHFIKSAKSGVKVPTDMKNDINFSVDNTGVLQIVFSDKLSRLGTHRNGIVVLVYGPNIDKLALSNSSSLVLTAKTDSLSINIKSTEMLIFGSPIIFSSNGKVTKEINQTDIKKLNISLDGTIFYSGNINYKNLNITGKNSTINIEGEPNENKNIENLTVNTFENSKLKIENVIVNKISGSLSDETTIAMPVKYLKQMLNN